MNKSAKKVSPFQATVFIILAVLLVLFFVVGNKKIEQKENAISSESLTATASVEPAQTIDQSQLTWTSGETVAVAVLMYHHIGPLPSDADDIRKGLTVSQENFENQLKYLKQNQYNVMTIAQMYPLVAEGKLPAKTVILTFDDGYQDNYLYAEPLLRDYGFKGTFNIITSKIGQPEYMTEEEIVALDKMGHELSSHTVTHPDLATLTGAKLQTELVDSKKYLENLTGKPVVTLCYPAGKFSPEVEADAQVDGYKMAVTTEASQGTLLTSAPYEIPRYRINPTTNLSGLLK